MNKKIVFSSMLKVANTSQSRQHKHCLM